MNIKNVETVLIGLLIVAIFFGTYAYYSFDNNTGLDNTMNFMALSALLGLVLSVLERFLKVS
jgi:hypothetical protein